MYYKLYIKKANRIISSATTNKSTLRDNSGLFYFDSSGVQNYGTLLMVFVFKTNESCVPITPLHCSGEIICKDAVTNAQIDSHIVYQGIDPCGHMTVLCFCGNSTSRDALNIVLNYY